ncbi:MAG: hypothetical protein QF486_02385 [Candidatus Woesearchaeota archaeon]|jgi:hypothetical protein|nr:hypothetical protein [Candidatus Woesearchaeota archaeon]MDP7181400.1 hypothetical protein [Candidatus Woesearchaeota archaeon]MDP7198442.1 hypothetical protein [Candidatus Woesearchaeota archaeon]MDP7466816.1 hypothetical protein [Candidatus Woesearchaeota archaeon]MDP7648041.1 hypothetical protein [Candidatus Woesearchaeota archaeon]
MSGGKDIRGPEPDWFNIAVYGEEWERGTKKVPTELLSDYNRLVLHSDVLGGWQMPSRAEKAYNNEIGVVLGSPKSHVPKSVAAHYAVRTPLNQGRNENNRRRAMVRLLDKSVSSRPGQKRIEEYLRPLVGSFGIPEWNCDGSSREVRVLSLAYALAINHRVALLAENERILDFADTFSREVREGKHPGFVCFYHVQPWKMERKEGIFVPNSHVKFRNQRASYRPSFEPLSA